MQTIKIEYYCWGYRVVIKRKRLGFIPYWKHLFDSPFLEDCEKFYSEILEGKYKELLS